MQTGSNVSVSRPDYQGDHETPGIPGGWESGVLVLRSACLRANDESGTVRGIGVSKCPGQECLHLSRPQIPRVLLAVKVDETICSVDVSLLGEQAVVPNAQRFTHRVEQPRWLCCGCIHGERRRHVTRHGCKLRRTDGAVQFTIDFNLTLAMQTENEKNDAAARNRWYKMRNWKVHVEKIERHFGFVCEHEKKEAFFENLYVSRNDEHRQVQLFAGSHPIGNSEVTRDDFGGEIGHKLHSEHGAALVLSQSTLGDVAVILYPYSSEKLSRVQPYIIWAIFSDPTKITNAVLKSAIRDFFRYMRVSGALFSESSLDRRRIQYLEFRSKKYTGRRYRGASFFPLVMGVSWGSRFGSKYLFPMEMKSNMALNLAPFGRWTLRNKSAQRRFALR